MDAVAEKEFLGGQRQLLHEKPVQISPVNPNIISDILYIDVVMIVVLDKVYGGYQISVFRMRKHFNLAAGEIAEDQKQISQQLIVISGLVF